MDVICFKRIPGHINVPITCVCTFWDVTYTMKRWHLLVVKELHYILIVCLNELMDIFLEWVVYLQHRFYFIRDSVIFNLKFYQFSSNKSSLKYSNYLLKFHHEWTKHYNLFFRVFLKPRIIKSLWCINSC